MQVTDRLAIINRKNYVIVYNLARTESWLLVICSATIRYAYSVLVSTKATQITVALQYSCGRRLDSGLGLYDIASDIVDGWARGDVLMHGGWCGQR